MAENIKEYREGYNAGKAAGPASVIGHGFFSMVYSDDYREGFRDAQEGRDFNPVPSRLDEPDLADEVGGCLFGIFMSGIELFFRVLFWPVRKLYDLLGFKISFCISLAVLAVVMVTHPFRPPAPRERDEAQRQSFAIGTEQQPPRTTGTAGALAGGTDSVGVEPKATFLSLGSFSDGSVQLDLWQDESANKQLLGRITLFSQDVSENPKVGELANVRGTGVSGDLGFTSRLRGEEVSFDGVVNGEAIQGKLHSSREKEPFDLDLTRVEKQYEKNYSNRHEWSKETAEQLACCGPTATDRVQQNSPTLGPSFDCMKATQHSEKLVCASPELAVLDLALANAYRDAAAIAGNQGKKELRTQQNYWLRHKRELCPDIACLKNTYESRIAELKAASR